MTGDMVVRPLDVGEPKLRAPQPLEAMLGVDCWRLFTAQHIRSTWLGHDSSCMTSVATRSRVVGSAKGVRRAAHALVAERSETAAPRASRWEGAVASVALSRRCVREQRDTGGVASW